MRALWMGLAGAMLLSACSKGVSPQAPAVDPTPTPVTEHPSPAPVSPTDVLAGGSGTAQSPPSAPDSDPPPPPPPPAPVPLEADAVAMVIPAENEPSAVDHVDVALTMSGVPGQGTVDVEFVAPGGLPYEKRTASVEAPPEESRTLHFVLPVAGTAVAGPTMKGTWEVRFFLDGASLTATTFTLAP